MKRIISGMLGGVAMHGMVSVAQGQFRFGLLDTNRDTFVNPVEFGTGLDRDGFLGRNEYYRAMFDGYDTNDDLLLVNNDVGLF